jgi:methyl-accepting chemotaxis protein
LTSVIVGLVVVILGAVIQWFQFPQSDPAAARHIFGPVSLIVLIFLAISAYRARKTQPEHFDLLVGAETIIAFGIGCLVISLALALFWISFNPALTSGSLDLARLAPIVWLFGEGLASVAVATLLGMLLRNLEILRFGGSTLTGADAMDSAYDGLATRLDDLKGKIRTAGDALDGLTEVFKTAADKHHSSAGRIEGALTGLAETIAEEGVSFRAEVGKLKKAVVDSMNGVEKITGKMRDAAAGLASEAERGGTALMQMSEQAADFKKSLAEGTRLLDGLAKLIAAVESFIDPHRSKP